MITEHMGGPPRRVPIGAEVTSQRGERGAHFRVWAPTHERITLVVDSPARREIVMTPESSGHHAVFVDGLAPGARYRFRLGDQAALHADPASRFQPEGPFGPSQLVDPTGFPWSDAAWTGIDPRDHVLYELHVGTFTPAGTWAAAAEHLGFLAEVGITTLELMPVGDFAGAYNWGYDGVNLWAPSRNYGTPDDMRRFVDRAHAAGLAVLIDVVYNHFGPSGNSMFEWSPYYKAARATEWGEAIDFDGPQSAGVREYFVSNAAYWIDEFHLDGLRLDATQTIADRSPERGGEHVLAEIARRVREAGRGRRIFLVGENEPQDTAMLGGAIALDALWNDDFHHTARVALTGVIEGYLHDYRGTPQELISTFKHGFLYQGQMYPWQHKPRGTPTRGVEPSRFVHYLENHDQIANLGFGERLAELSDPALLRAMTAVLLLGPELPLLFQGQETGSRRPWQFFVDHCEELRDPVRRGRAAFVGQFARLGTPEGQAALPDPCDPATFRACVLDPAERTLANPHVRIHRDLLRLRREDPAFAGGTVDGALLGTDVFAVRFFGTEPARDRLLLVNLGRTFARGPNPEPLTAPPPGTGWRLAWSSEDPAYGGHGTPEVVTRERVAIPARAAVLLVPDPVARLAPEADAPEGEQPR
jgi:maltooligosyltrehalose trehalohydrolase